MNGRTLQWGGRFGAPPDLALLAFGSSLETDLALARFDVACSRAHVAALRGGAVVTAPVADALEAALAQIEAEIATGEFAARARMLQAEDVHGAIDARVRELAPEEGGWLHAGRSRNDQVATTLLLYVRERAHRGVDTCVRIARDLLVRAETALAAGVPMAAFTHWQPAQPMLLAFWLEAVAESMVRAARRYARVASDAAEGCPLGSGACTGSSLPLARDAASQLLGFGGPSRNALDAVGDRDVALDLLQADVRALVAASRVCTEVVMYASPAFGCVRLGDAASTGSSLMPQKRNPDAFELVRAAASSAVGTLAGALATIAGLGLSYHRDLQETKALVIRETERTLTALAAFERALQFVTWDASALERAASSGFTVATDIADALIGRGVSSRRAHELVGHAVRRAEHEGRRLDSGDLDALAGHTALSDLHAPLDPHASIAAKRTTGSTNPECVSASIQQLRGLLETEFGAGPG